MSRTPVRERLCDRNRSARHERATGRHPGREQMTLADASLELPVPKPSIKSLALEDLAAHFAAQGEPAYRAKQVADWLYQKRVDSFAAMTDLPAATRSRLAEEFSFVGPEIVRVLGSADTTRKFLFRLGDGSLI